MLHSRWRLFAALTLLLWSLPSPAIDDRTLTDELSSAKSMAVVFRVIAGSDERQASAIAKYKAKMESKVIAEIQKEKLFELSPDPSKADLVCLVIAFWGQVFRDGKSIWNRSASELYLHSPETVMIFRGGSNPQWSPFPLWMETGTQDHRKPDGLLKEFHKALKKAKEGGKPLNALQGPPQTTPDGAAVKDDQSSASTEHTDSAAEEPGDAAAEGPDGSAQKVSSTGKAPGPPTVFCQLDFKGCNPAKEIYSASTLLICEWRYRCDNKNLKKVLQPGGRWTLVQDPAKADLIMILSDDSANDPGQGGLIGGMLGGTRFATMYLFKGGAKPDWEAAPLLTMVGGAGLFAKVRHGSGGTVVEKFEKFVSDTAPSAAQPNHQKGIAVVP